MIRLRLRALSRTRHRTFYVGGAIAALLAFSFSSWQHIILRESFRYAIDAKQITLIWRFAANEDTAVGERLRGRARAC